MKSKNVYRLVPALLMAALLFTGCDFFRSIVGKPTSKDLERMKIEAAEKAARQKRQQDSLKAAQAVQLEREMYEAAARKYLLDESAGKYHVIIGSYKLQDNASKMFARLENGGYSPRYVMFENGFYGVSVAGYDNMREARKTMYDVMELAYCPEDVWVYDVAQALHRTDYKNF